MGFTEKLNDGIVIASYEYMSYSSYTLLENIRILSIHHLNSFRFSNQEPPRLAGPKLSIDQQQCIAPLPPLYNPQYR
uniref:Uncharacterized protein n=1 Tax=Wuchereria bancrofti TaxID=6293 RepID=A0A1I8ECY1_WUCBA